MMDVPRTMPYIHTHFQHSSTWVGGEVSETGPGEVIFVIENICTKTRSSYPTHYHAVTKTRKPYTVTHQPTFFDLSADFNARGRRYTSEHLLLLNEHTLSHTPALNTLTHITTE